MSKLPLNLDRPGRFIIGGAPEGHDARVLADLAASARHGLVHIAQEAGRAATLADAVNFFAPEIEVLIFPAWDCLPYDRISPNGAAVSGRIDTLTRLIVPRDHSRPRIVIATVNAIVQRVAPAEAFANATFVAKVGDRIDLDRLQHFLLHNGYHRAETVREPGEFATRGGIIDLFPPGMDEPVRLDLFGDELEGVRGFDPLSQRTTGKYAEIALKPVSELFLDADSIQRFRAGYRELFGVVTDDPLYESVSAGRKYAGMEHWMPLFHPQMATLFDYLPGAAVTLDPQADQARQDRLAQVADFYQARKELQGVEKKANAVVYRPLPPDRLYLTGEEFDGILAERAVAELSPFAPDGTGRGPDAGGRRGRDFADARNQPDVNVFDAMLDHADRLQHEGKRVFVAAYGAGSRDRLAHLLNDRRRDRVEPVDSYAESEGLSKAKTAVIVLPLEHGFVSPDLAVVTEQDILGDRLSRPAKKRKSADKFILEVSSLKENDLVVHADHGIGRFIALETLEVSGAPHDCLRIVYEGGDKLFVPVENIEVLSRFGSEDTGVQLDRLGGAAWQARKAKVKKRLMDLAAGLLKIAAARQLQSTEALNPPEGVYEEFAARFPYPETEDQLRVIEEVMADLSSGKPMDRLVCGDVGFGKTEIALRAAFVVAMAGYQVAVVAPTTLLARQHYQNFCKRFAGMPVRIEQLSRLVTAKDANETRKGLNEGRVDIVIGTHALLSKTIEFKRLGLVVVDEEQRFGVKQKEKLKELTTNVHVLTLTATPIPRTLQMALTGVRELSLIATPPVDRLAVRTFVLPYDPVVIREAIMREHFRGGQSFYVCPRIEDMPRLEERLRTLVPEVKVVSAHGGMSATELEERMTAFYEGAYDVLLATNIIESGLDIPRANTMVIHRADMFGLAQLYQIRGRIGRSKQRGYAYLTYGADRKLNATAQQRLHVIETLDTLGAGFQLASYDMDIRGAGNLLGEEQSGQIREVGIELYQQMLEEAVAEARGGILPGEEAERWTPQINLGMPVLIPDSYVADLNIRLHLYRRISELVDRNEIEAFAAELIDRFGPLPAEVENLLDIVAIKQLCRTAGVERVEAGPKGAVVSFRNNSFGKVDQLVQFVSRKAGVIKLRPDQKLVYVQSWDRNEQRVKGVHGLMNDLAKIAA